MKSKIPTGNRAGVSLRAILIGLLLIPINSYWIFMMEIVRYQGHPTTISLFFSSIFNLVLLIILNGFLRRRMPHWVFSQGELITIYVMLNIAAALVGHDSLQILISVMPYATYFASPENNWQALFEGRLPDWLMVTDPQAVKHFYQGGNLYDPANYGPWIMPVVCWTAFIGVLLGMFLCMNALLRKQWTEREKLSYPLVQLPLDMTAEGAPLFKDKLLWYGFAVAAAIDIINGLAALYPSIPPIPIKFGDPTALITARPWSNLGGLPVKFYPFGIGLGMLLPVDLLFSCWFFFWLTKIERVAVAALGYDTIPNMPYINEQSLGAYLGICLFAILVSRKHLADLVRHFIGTKMLDDKGEPMPYRAAMWFIIFGLVFLTVFGRAAGMSTWVLVPFFLTFFAVSIAVTRMRAELGPPAHDLHFSGPDEMIASIVGPRNLGTQDLSALSMFSWFNRAYRGHAMPFQLEGLKMGERAKMSYRGLYWAMGIAGVFGTIVAFWVMLHVLYHEGAARIGPPNVPVNDFGRGPWDRLNGWIKTPLAPDSSRAMAIGIGFVLTMILNSLRMKIAWFPFHPVGYAVAGSWSMHMLWAPMLIAWIIKLAVLRYGGLKLYRQVLPFFLGIILGECVVGSLWPIWGIITRVPSYAFWP